MWRCLNDLFAYCAGEPQSNPTPTTFYYTSIDGKRHTYKGTAPHCKRDPEHCKLYRSVQQIYHKELVHTAG